MMGIARTNYFVIRLYSYYYGFYQFCKIPVTIIFTFSKGAKNSSSAVVVCYRFFYLTFCLQLIPKD